MTKDEARRKLEEAGLSVTSEQPLPNGTGTQLRLSDGAIVNVFDNGNFNVQGKNQDAARAALGAPGGTARGTTAAVPRKAFVVYGHDDAARDQLEAMLRRWQVEPIILGALPSAGQTIIEKLESYTAEASYAIVLATPDDEGHRAGHPDERMSRARQNVVLELGMMLAILGRSRVAILLKHPERMERPSDIQGLVYIPFNDRVDEAGTMLAKEMTAQGIPIDLKRL